MSEPFPGPPALAKSREDRLDSWKEVAAYLNRDVTTVQRWEKREAMPVHRHLHDRIGSVYAFKAELDAWLHTRNPPELEDDGDTAASSVALAPSAPVSTPTAPIRWTVVLPVATAGVALAMAVGLWFRSTEFFWRSPIADARFQRVTDSEGVEQAATVSRDGRFVAFLSDRDGPTDVWVTQVGSGQFHNLTRGSAPELVNPSVRTLGFSPDGAVVTFWVRGQGGSTDGAIGIWAVPTLGGQPRPLLEGIAESDSSPDGTRLVYHTPGPGDPMFVTDASRRSEGQRIFTAPAGLHAHFPLWAADGRSIYFVEGALPDQLDIWRISADGGAAERITSHKGRVSHPVWLNRRTLAYLASDPDGSGPWLHSMDVERRIPHRLSAGVDRYASLAASADGRRLVATVASRKRTLWRLPVADSPATISTPVRITLTTGTGFSPRLGPRYLLYVSGTGVSESIWKLADGESTELWTGTGAQIFGGPVSTSDGQRIAFSVRQEGKTLLYVMQADGTNTRIVTDALELQGSPAWAPDGQSITSAAIEGGAPRLFRVPLDGSRPSSFVHESSTESGVGARRRIRGLFRSRHRYDVRATSRQAHD